MAVLCAGGEASPQETGDRRQVGKSNIKNQKASAGASKVTGVSSD